MKEMLVISNLAGVVLYSGEHGSIKEAVEAAVATGSLLCGVDLRGANLSGSFLCGANLCGANLGGADLRGADLRGSDLSGANLGGSLLSDSDLRGSFLRGSGLSYASLRGANLSDADLRGSLLRGSDLRGANLRRADLSGVDLTGAIGLPDAPVVADIDRAILNAAVQSPARFDMAVWSEEGSCGTTYCRAGWAVELAGEAGYALEKALGPSAAGALIYTASRPGRRVPDFYASTAAALADLRERAANPD